GAWRCAVGERRAEPSRTARPAMAVRGPGLVGGSAGRSPPPVGADRRLLGRLGEDLPWLLSANEQRHIRDLRPGCGCALWRARHLLVATSLVAVSTGSGVRDLE